LQVFDVVVLAVTVDVMNNLILAQGSTKFFFHDDAMLVLVAVGDSPAGVLYKHVAVLAYKAPTSPVTITWAWATDSRTTLGTHVLVAAP
jgi:hypothetical protein